MSNRAIGSAIFLVVGLTSLTACKSDNDPEIDASTSSGPAPKATGGSSSIGNTSTGGSTSANQCGQQGTLAGFDADIGNFSVVWAEPSGLSSTLQWDGSVGLPTPGSLSVTANFTAAAQKLIIGGKTTSPLDLTGEHVTAYIHVDKDPATTMSGMASTGGTSDNAATVSIYAKTGSAYRWMNGPWANIVPGGWIPLVLDPENPTYSDATDASVADPSDIREIGFQIATSQAGTFTTGAFHVDSLAVQKGPISPAPPWNFDCGTEAFAVTYMSHNSIVPEFSWSGDVGSPNLGALKLIAAFSAPSQEIGIGRIVAGSALNLSGKTLSAKVQLASGMSTDATHLGSAKLYVATGDRYVCAIGASATLTPGSSWATVTLNLDAPDYTCTSGTYDPKVVNELGLIIDTGSSGTYAPATLYIDSITVAP